VVWTAITPREPIEPESIEERQARQPERLYLVADSVGAGLVAPSDTPGRLFVSVRVLPEARRAGVGSALYAGLEPHALALGPFALSTHVAEDSAEGRRFAEQRGYWEIGRQVELVRALGGGEHAEAPPAGIEIRPLADPMRPAAYEVAKEAFADLPLPEPVPAPEYDDWVREELDGPIAFAAFDGGQLVGYAALIRRPAEGLLEHGLTACLRTHRGRGIGTALKQAQIAWAAEHGYRELITWTQEGNAAMRRVNEKLGYVEQPAALMMRRDLT
jgi:GNAT superfamily N-acetyltransferase